MTHCTGAQDWRTGVRSLSHARGVPRSHTLLHAGRRSPEPTPREPDPDEAVGE